VRAAVLAGRAIRVRLPNARPDGQRAGEKYENTMATLKGLALSSRSFGRVGHDRRVRFPPYAES